MEDGLNACSDLVKDNSAPSQSEALWLVVEGCSDHSSCDFPNCHFFMHKPTASVLEMNTTIFKALGERQMTAL